jgi:predicted 3-demethylubiquinone-9 3-methyltransferase (glyoxalase superfamily)
VPSLWFDEECEEAVNFYVATFNAAPHSTHSSRVISIERHPEDPQGGPMANLAGKVRSAIFELDGQRFMALDGGPLFKFTEAISFYVECDDQAEVDHFWDALSADPEAGQCGWLKDRYGVSWQIVPRQLIPLLFDADRARAGRVMDVMLEMKKLVIADLENA